MYSTCLFCHGHLGTNEAVEQFTVDAVPIDVENGDFSGGAPYTLEFDVRPVYHFVISLSEDAGSTDDLPAADRKWLAEWRSEQGGSAE